MIAPAVITMHPDESVSGTAPAIQEVEAPTLSHEWVIVVEDRDHAYSLVSIDPEQAWFWTDAWQRMEREADEDLREGRFVDFTGIEDFIDSLRTSGKAT